MKKEIRGIQLPKGAIELTEEEMLNIRGGCYINGMPISEEKELELPNGFRALTDEELLKIKGGCYIYGMPKSDYKELVKVVKESGVKPLSGTKLLCFFEAILLNLDSSYNTNMELFTESEALYEITKSEILDRFNH